jgi:predicted transcriptional regulator
MHFNIYLDDDTGERLKRAAQEAGESRNALIRRAVGDWLARQGLSQWPEAVLRFEGIADFPAFEASRDEFGAPADDPLA